MSWSINGISIGVSFDFSNGATFGYSFILGDPKHGILGENVLAETASDIVDISDQVSNISIAGGYNLLQDQFQASQTKIRVIDPDGAWNPTNPASPYFGKLVPNRKMRVFATYAGTTHFLFSGYTQSYDYSYPKDQTIGYVDITCTDAFRLYQLTNVINVTGQAAGQDCGTRMNKILDTIQWPNSLREISTGGTPTLQADPGTIRTALDALKMVEFTGQGGFYIDGEGDAVYKTRNEIQLTNGANPVYFSNAGDGIGYKTIRFALDDKLIINQANIQNIGGVMQTVLDDTSAAKYFPHTYTQQKVLAQTDADALNIARIYVATRKDTTIRIDTLVLDLSTPDYATGIAAALNLDYFNAVKIKNVGQDGTVIEKTLQVMGTAYDITPNNFNVTFTTSETISEAFILGSTTFGILGQSMLTY
jgi:hypothetical protein